MNVSTAFSTTRRISASETALVTPFIRHLGPSGVRPATARFYNHKTKGFLNALIDFVMLSPGLAAAGHPDWRIWHPFDDAGCFEDAHLRDALLDASDHFPVSVDLHFP